MLSLLQIDKVDPEYFRTSKRIDIEEETKIRATKEEADNYFRQNDMECESIPCVGVRRLTTYSRC